MESRFKRFFTSIWQPILAFLIVYFFIVYVIAPLTR